MTDHASSQASAGRAYVVTGPTSGIGYQAALALAAHGTVVLVGRKPDALAAVRSQIEGQGGRALSVVCDLSDVTSVGPAVEEIAALRLPIAGLLNNAGVNLMTPAKSAQGWDLTFATNFLGPFALTEGLVRHLSDGAHVVFVASAVEDPERVPARVVGMRGGRFISVAASARGEWQAGGSRLPGADAYATSKQAVLAAALAFAREIPRLRFNAVEPGITPDTGLSRGSNALVRRVFSAAMYLPPFGRYRSTPARAAALVVKVLTDESSATGVYYDEKGHPMRGSALVHEPAFQDRVVVEARALLATVPTRS